MDRRHFLLGASVATVSSVMPGLAQIPTSDIEIVSALPPLPPDLSNKASLPPVPYSEAVDVGTAPPSTDEIDKAYELLVNAPLRGAPIDIAQYFLAVGAGAYGETYRPFAREWPVRANPLIFHFFSATRTKPEGDVTAWCAAFMNWCLLRAHASSVDEIGQAPGFYVQKGKPFAPENLTRFSTNNASSGSFRCWDEISSPVRGDIVVLKDAGTDDLTKRCQGSGHVTFFVRNLGPGWVQALGGNQSQLGSNGAITIANVSTQPGSRFLKYVSPRI
jgi:hypothetical protein